MFAYFIIGLTAHGAQDVYLTGNTPVPTPPSVPTDQGDVEGQDQSEDEGQDQSEDDEAQEEDN